MERYANHIAITTLQCKEGHSTQELSRNVNESELNYLCTTHKSAYRKMVAFIRIRYIMFQQSG